jgi:hypothetical protein
MSIEVTDIDKLYLWIRGIDYNPTSQLWTAKLFKGHIAQAPTFPGLCKIIIDHVITEIIWLTCDALGVETQKLTIKTREIDVVDCRFVAAIIATDFAPRNAGYNGIIGRRLGWSNHCMTYHSRKNRDKREIKMKMAKVYSRYPFLDLYRLDRYIMEN